MLTTDVYFHGQTLPLRFTLKSILEVSPAIGIVEGVLICESHLIS